MNSEYLALTSEVHELNSILAEIPHEDIIERRAFESRLRSAQEKLDKLPNYSFKKKARLTFRGRPVFGSYGVAADFGSKAAGVFSDAFSAVLAGINESLNYMGPIPDKSKNQLIITGTAIGSFGFEFELPGQTGDMFPEHKKAEDAIEKLQALMRVSAEGSDDDVTELVEEVHPRAVKKIAEFLGYLVQQQAWCGLEFNDRYFKFSNIDQIRSAADRLQEDNIRERDVEFIGEFVGILPHSRSFEFVLNDRSGVIKGKVDIAIEDPDIINREWLHKPVNLIFRVIQVGQGRPRYTLFDLSVIKILPGF